MSLFKKAGLFTDIHFGEHQDSEEHNEDCLEFLGWFAEQVQESGCDTIIFLGDYHHNRVRTENRTGWYSRRGVEIINAIGLPVYWLIGNHELYLKDSREIHSLQYLSKYPNIIPINQITQVGDVVFSPWLVGNEHQNLLELQSRYVFGHFELPFFLMNQVIQKVYDGKGLHIDDFQNCEAVYSGHFHKRQVRLNQKQIPIYYIGNCFGHNMNDVNDPERGMAILEWGETLPEYRSWQDAPSYHRFTMTEFLDLLDKDTQPFGQRSTVEVLNDMDLDAETLTALREAVPVRQLRFPPQKSTTMLTETVSEKKKYASLDHLVESKLKSLNYDGKYDPDLLVEIYREIGGG